MGSKFFTDAVNEHFHFAASFADVDIEMLFLDEQFTYFSEESPVGSFVKLFDPDVIKRGLASLTRNRVACWF
jgi:hypothetical protein